MGFDRQRRLSGELTDQRAHVRVLRPLIVLTTTLTLLLGPLASAQGAGLGALRAAADPLVLAGCEANLPITRLLLRAFGATQPGAVFRLQVVGSTAGIALAVSGAVHLGLTSRPLRPEELRSGVDHRLYGRTAVVLGADPAIAETGLTSQDLRRIYRGTKTRWGDGRRVALLTRESGDGAIESLRRALPGFARAYADGADTSHWTVLYSEPSMHEAFLTIPGALGLSDLGVVTIEHLPIRVLAIDGVTPTLETLASGSYPFIKTLWFVWQEHRLSPLAAAFMDFIDSNAGAAILRAHGYLPAR
jgi:phosphate transport system substrate-binding protein